MPLRLFIAYAIIFLLTAAGGLALWVYVIRGALDRRGRRIRRARRSLAVSRPSSNGHQPAVEAD